jgi:hypothetical protein
VFGVSFFQVEVMRRCALLGVMRSLFLVSAIYMEELVVLAAPAPNLQEG